MSQIRIQFLGSGDAFGSGGRLQTCIYVESETACFLLDCGASSMPAMKRYGVSPTSVDVILLSHLHGDHFGGLPFFILDAQLVSKRVAPLLIAGPPGTEERVRSAQEVFFPGSSQTPQKFPIGYAEWTEERPTQVRGLVVTPVPVVHTTGTAFSYALRVECEGKVIAYSGDTEWTDRLIPAAQDADLFICEAYCFDKRMKFHLDYRTLMAHRSVLGCKQLILTHMSDDVLGRIEEVDVEYAEDGKQILL